MRERLTYANVMATVAVFIALGGTGYAAVTLKKGQVKGKHIAKNAVTSKKVKNGSLKAGDFRAGQLPRGAKGETGAPGAVGPTGPAGAAYDPDDVLQPGRTLVGSYSVVGRHPFPDEAFAFRIPLPAPLDENHVHYLSPGATSEVCPGAGEAAPGHLCVYSTSDNPDDLWGIYPPSTGGVGADPWGFGLVRSASDVTGTNLGTYAVTAPLE